MSLINAEKKTLELPTTMNCWKVNIWLGPGLIRSVIVAQWLLIEAMLETTSAIWPSGLGRSWAFSTPAAALWPPTGHRRRKFAGDWQVVDIIDRERERNESYTAGPGAVFYRTSPAVFPQSSRDNWWWNDMFLTVLLAGAVKVLASRLSKYPWMLTVLNHANFWMLFQKIRMLAV